MAARYKTMNVDGRKEYVHRYVMQQYLGRPLRSGENVHHRGPDRYDNRLDNLELWVTSQPAGQTVPDLVDHAIDLLNRYFPELTKHHRRQVRHRLDQGVVDHLSGKAYSPEIHPDQIPLW